MALAAEVARSVLPPVQPYHPTTFLERGVSVPFTTPFLGGARARPTEKRGIELIVPNPSGGRGVYVVPWGSCVELCRPTLHDKVLSERVAALLTITPATIRRTARELAAEGLAGEEAMDAARDATEADRGDRVIANYLLLMGLIEQVNVAPPASPASPASPVQGGAGGAAGQDMPDLKHRARLTTAWIAPRIGQTADWVANALEELADVMQIVGVGVGRAGGRVPRLIDMLREATDGVGVWGQTQQSEELTGYAQMFRNVAELTLPLAEDILMKARSLSTNIVELLRMWAADRERLVHMVARPEWLLDGWEPICLIWKFARDDAARRAALAEMASLLPILPREIGEWCEVPAFADSHLNFRRMVHLNEDWRSGSTVIDLIARNEHLRAAAV